MSEPVVVPTPPDPLTPEERLIVTSVAQEIARAILRLPKDPMRRAAMTQAQWLLDGR